MSSRTLADGTVLNSNVRLTPAANNESKSNNFGLYKAQILEAIPKGHKKNLWKKGVEYKAVLVGGHRDGEVLSNLIPLDSFGGADNFNEIVYTPRTTVLSGKNQGDGTPPSKTNGSYVIVAFLNGHYNHPVIISGWAQPNNTDYGASEDDGVRLLGRYQGLRWNIDKSGKLTIDHNGTSITLDGAEGDVTVTTQNKLTVNATGDVDVNSSGSVTVASQGDATVTSSGSANVSGANGITFTGPFTKIGSAGATEHLIFGDAFKTYFDGHIHGGGPPPSTPMPTGTLSTKATVD